MEGLLRAGLAHPVFEEELFFGGEELVRGSEEGAEGGGHLESDEEEDANPDADGVLFFVGGLVEHF